MGFVMQAVKKDGESNNHQVVSWFPKLIFALSLLGLAISAYLSIAHLSETAILACPENSTINCAKVTTSPQSILFGVPVAYLGLGFFLAYSVLNWPRNFFRRNFSIARLGMAVVSLAMVLWLVYAELLIINAICLWCSAVHLITLSIFLLVVYSTIEYKLLKQ